MPDVLFLASPNMVRIYEKYHDCVRFDVTYSVCKLRDSKGAAWGFGIFSGFTESLSPCVFGMCFVKEETIKDFEFLFRTFFEQMGYVPDSIITDQQASVITALGKLNI